MGRSSIGLTLDPGYCESMARYIFCGKTGSRRDIFTNAQVNITDFNTNERK